MNNKMRHLAVKQNKREVQIRSCMHLCDLFPCLFMPEQKWGFRHRACAAHVQVTRACGVFRFLRGHVVSCKLAYVLFSAFALQFGPVAETQQEGVL